MNIYEIMSLALDGKVVKANDDFTKQIIKDRFYVSDLSEVAPLVAAYVGTVYGVPIAKHLNKLKNRFIACRSDCKGSESIDKHKCLAKCKAAYNSKMKAAKIAGKKAGKKIVKAEKSKK